MNQPPVLSLPRYSIRPASFSRFSERSIDRKEVLISKNIFSRFVPGVLQIS